MIIHVTLCIIIFYLFSYLALFCCQALHKFSFSSQKANSVISKVGQEPLMLHEKGVINGSMVGDANRPTVQLRMSTIVADTLLSEGENSSEISSDSGDLAWTVGEYVFNKSDLLTQCILFLCGGYHVDINFAELSVLKLVVLGWRAVLIASTMVFLSNEMQLLVTLQVDMRSVLMRMALLFQCLILIPTIRNSSERFRCKVSKTQTGVMEIAVQTYMRFFVLGVLAASVYAYCVAFYGVYYLEGFRLAFEAIGYACCCLLSTWPILFVVLDVSVTLGEIRGLRELVNRKVLTSVVYKHSYNNSYQLVNTNSVSVCNAAAFCAYFNMFTFIVYLITIPPTESVLLTLGFCVGILFREASFIFFIFPFFVKVNSAYIELVDKLADEVWQHQNGIDDSTNLCLLSMRKPLSLSILGRLATMKEMYGQLSGLVLLSLTTFLRMMETNRASQ